ncbi:MAG: Ig-like domain-containing protein, partial [Pseudomonadota bacterium]
DPRNGGDLIADGQVQGGGIVDIGDAPTAIGKDWVVMLQNPEPGGGTVTPPTPPASTGPWLANENGHFVIEAESAIDQDLAGGWQFHTTDDLPEGHEAPSGGAYIEASTSNFGRHLDVDDHPNSLLTYEFLPETDGYIRINLIASHEGNPTEENDTWVGVLLDGEPVNAIDQGGRSLEEKGPLELYKAFSSGGRADKFILANGNIDNVAKPIVVPVTAGEVHTFVLMERSAGHQVDKIVLEFGEEPFTGPRNDPVQDAPRLKAEPLSPRDDSEEPPANTAPVAADDAVSLAYAGGRTVDVLANDTDADGDALTITGVTASAGLSAEIVSGGVRVTAAEGFSGAGSVSYTITDGDLTDEGEIAVTVAAPDPVAIELVLYDTVLDEAIATLEDGATVALDAAALDTLTVVATPAGTDVESMRLELGTTVERVENIAPYALFGDTGGDLAAGTLGFGAHDLAVTAYSDDGAGGLVLGERSLDFTLVQANRAPVVLDRELSLEHGGQSVVDVLADASDPDGDALSLAGIEATDGLTARLVDGGIAVTAEDGFEGAGTISYDVEDGRGASTPGLIEVEVAAAPPPSDSPAPVPPPVTGPVPGPGARMEIGLLDRDVADLH